MGARLGEAVALAHAALEDGLHVLLHLDAERRRAREHDLDAAAQQLLCLLEGEQPAWLGLGLGLGLELGLELGLGLGLGLGLEASTHPRPMPSLEVEEVRREQR